MKKYCLTQCSKDKMSNGLQNVIEVIAITLAVLALALVASIVFFILGAVIQFTMLGVFDINEFEFNPIIIGIIYPILAGTVGYLVYLIYELVKWVWKGFYYVAKNITMNVVAPEKASCRLFEECT